MKLIQESKNDHHYPRRRVKNLELRKRDLVVRIANWMKDKDEPAFDVEIYIGGVYDNNESKSFCLSSGLTKKDARQAAVKFAASQFSKLL